MKHKIITAIILVLAILLLNINIASAAIPAGFELNTNKFAYYTSETVFVSRSYDFTENDISVVIYDQEFNKIFEGILAKGQEKLQFVLSDELKPGKYLLSAHSYDLRYDFRSNFFVFPKLDETRQSSKFDGTYNLSVPIDVDYPLHIDFSIKDGIVNLSRDSDALGAYIYDNGVLEIIISSCLPQQNSMPGPQDYTTYLSLVKGILSSDGILSNVTCDGERVSKDTSQNQISQNITNDEKCVYNYRPVELQYDIEYGNVESTCYNKETVSLLMEITSIGSSKIIVHLPKTMIFSLDQECNSAGEIMVLLNEEEIDSSRLTISETSSERIATLILPEGFNNIEFIGTFTLGRPSPLDICGEVHGYDTQYVPPLKQWRFGVDPTEVRCNKGLELAFKTSDNSAICVKAQTKSKLVERGWIKIAITEETSNTIVHNNLQQLYVLTENELLRSDGDKLVSVKKLDKKFYKIVEDNNYLYLGIKNSEDENNIIILDSNFEQTNSYNFDKFFDFDVNDDIYLLDNDGLNTQHRLGTIEYPNVEFEKAGHDIIVNDRYAYILDNIVTPVYLHIIDISNPFEPVKFTQEYVGINTSLVTQEIDGERWYVLLSSNSQSGHSEFLNVYGSKPDKFSENASYELLGFDFDQVNPSIGEWYISDFEVYDNLIYAVGNEWGDERTIKFSIFSLPIDEFEPTTSDIATQLSIIELDDTEPSSNIVINGNSAFVGGQKGLYVIDISNPSDPTIKNVIKTQSPVRYLLVTSLFNVQYHEGEEGVNGRISYPLKTIKDRTCFTITNNDVLEFSDEFKQALADVSESETKSFEPEYINRGILDGTSLSLEKEFTTKLIKENNFTREDRHIDFDEELPLEYFYECYFEYEGRQYLLEFWMEQPLN